MGKEQKSSKVSIGTKRSFFNYVFSELVSGEKHKHRNGCVIQAATSNNVSLEIEHESFPLVELGRCAAVRRKTADYLILTGQSPCVQHTRMSGSGILVAQAASKLATAPLTGSTPNSGDTAWVLASTCLVLMMTLPGLMLFYGKQRALFRPPSAALS